MPHAEGRPGAGGAIFDPTVLCDFCMDSNVSGCFEMLLTLFINFYHYRHPGWRQVRLAAGLAAELAGGHELLEGGSETRFSTRSFSVTCARIWTFLDVLKNHCQDLIIFFAI